MEKNSIPSLCTLSRCIEVTLKLVEHPIAKAKRDFKNESVMNNGRGSSESKRSTKLS